MMQKFKDMNRWLQFGLSAVVAAVLLFAMVFEVSIPLPVFEEPAPAAPVVDISAQAVRERISIDARTDSYFYNGADLIGYSDDHATSTWDIDTSAGELTITSLVTETTGLAISGDLTVGNGTPDVTQDNEDGYVEGTFEVDGASRFDGAVDINATVTIDGGVVNIGGGTPAVAAGDNDLYVTGDLEVDGELELDGALDADSTSNFAGMVTLAAGATGSEDVENIMFPTVLSTDIAFGTLTGSIATVGASEVWLVHSVFVNVTTDFDTAGNDDATLEIGDGNDPDGFLVLADSQLQAADTAGTGFLAGWQGMEAAIVGAYLDANDNGFIYDGTDTIDYAITGTAIDAGAATVYVVYTRIE